MYFLNRNQNQFEHLTFISKWSFLPCDVRPWNLARFFFFTNDNLVILLWFCVEDRRPQFLAFTSLKPVFCLPSFLFISRPFRCWFCLKKKEIFSLSFGVVFCYNQLSIISVKKGRNIEFFFLFFFFFFTTEPRTISQISWILVNCFYFVSFSEING